jgi:hypothetical protein
LERGGSGTVGRGRAGRADHDQQHCYHHAPTVKPEAATAVVEFLMMSVRTLETCSAVHTSKRQVINVRICCIWLVDLFETREDFRPQLKYNVRGKKNNHASAKW